MRSHSRKRKTAIKSFQNLLGERLDEEAYDDDAEFGDAPTPPGGYAWTETLVSMAFGTGVFEPD